MFLVPLLITVIVVSLPKGSESCKRLNAVCERSIQCCGDCYCSRTAWKEGGNDLIAKSKKSKNSFARFVKGATGTTLKTLGAVIGSALANGYCVVRAEASARGVTACEGNANYRFLKKKAEGATPAAAEAAVEEEAAAEEVAAK